MRVETLHETEQLLIETTVVGKLKNNVFIVSPKDDGPSILIDAAEPQDDIVEWARSRNVANVLTTHNHHDHIGGIAKMRAAGIKVGIGTSDTFGTGTVDFEIEHNDSFKIANTELIAVHTPGHTPGSTCFELLGHNILFTGDTLFPGGPGATRNPRDFQTIMESVDELFVRYSDDFAILPGHGKTTTFGNERPHIESWRQRGW